MTVQKIPNKTSSEKVCNHLVILHTTEEGLFSYLAFLKSLLWNSVQPKDPEHRVEISRASPDILAKVQKTLN